MESETISESPVIIQMFDRLNKLLMSLR